MKHLLLIIYFISTTINCSAPTDTAIRSTREGSQSSDVEVEHSIVIEDWIEEEGFGKESDRGTTTDSDKPVVVDPDALEDLDDFDESQGNKLVGECPAQENSSELIGLPYPQKKSGSIKGIAYAPGNSNRRIPMLEQAGTKVVGYNIPWSVVEPSRKHAPCGGGDIQYNGYCYKDVIGGQIKDLNDAGIRVTAILYGVPAWARVNNRQCSPPNDSFNMFCAPDNAQDFALFAGMLAQAYDGKQGRGRISNFVIHNEVNSNIWFDIGCGSGKQCDVDEWVSRYADNYNRAYDIIKGHQSEARVLVSLEHAFGPEAEDLNSDYPLIAGSNFLKKFSKYVGERNWQVAFHPYAPNLLKVEFSVIDWPIVTYGNPGQIIGWLRQNFPNDPHVWEVQFTESGINSSSPGSSEEKQALGVCASTYNVLATPWVTDYIYHGMFDDGLMAQLQVGLFRSDESPKPAWEVWANQQDCGYENLPYTKLVRSTYRGRHWNSTRTPPENYTEEHHWYLLRDGDCKTQQILWECNVDNKTTFLSRTPECLGAVNMGPVGFSFMEQKAGLEGLYQCKEFSRENWFVSSDPQCEGEKTLQFLGYVKTSLL